MKRWKPWLIAAVVAAIGCGAFAALDRSGVELRAQLGPARLDCLLGAVGLCILYRLVNSTGWVFVLRALGHPMPLARGARIWITAETMRWLPGSIWGFCGRVYQAGKAGAPPVVAAASLPLELLLTIAAWATTAVSALYFCRSQFEWASFLGPRTFLIGALVLAAFGAVMAVALWRAFASRDTGVPAGAPRDLAIARPWWSRRPIAPAGRRCHAPAGLRSQLAALSQTRPRLAPLAFTFLLYTALCALNGLAFYCVLRALSDAPLSLTAAIGANACGWLAGFFAIGVPGGIGVREAASAAILAATIPVETVVAAAVLWRLVLIADELCCLTVLLAPAAWKRLVERPRPASALAADLRGPQP
jgi:hypothetical protein